MLSFQFFLGKCEPSLACAGATSAAGAAAGADTHTGGGSVLRGNSSVAAALAVALGHLLQSSHAVAVERLLPTMEDAARRLRATEDAEPSTLRSLAVRNSALLWRRGGTQYWRGQHSLMQTPTHRKDAVAFIVRKSKVSSENPSSK